MPYSSFTLPKVMADFGVTVGTSQDLFGHVPPVPLSPETRVDLDRNTPLALLIHTEKARSELIVSPMLADLWRQTTRRISVYSGVPLDVDVPAGLNGVCDFLIGRAPQLPEVGPPLFVVVEAKKDDIQGAYGQCAAEMVAALRMNASANSGVGTVHGCVTTGSIWRFMTLKGTQLDIDLIEYLISQPERIFGILMHMVGATPAAAAA